MFCFPLGPPFHPMLLLCIFSYTKSSVGDTPPPSRHGTVGKLASQPPPHSELKAVISFLSHPRRQGKDASTAKQRVPTAWVAHKPALEKLQLGRRQPRCSSPRPLPTAEHSPPQILSQSDGGLSASLSSCPTPSATGKLSLV